MMIHSKRFSQRQIVIGLSKFESAPNIFIHAFSAMLSPTASLMWNFVLVLSSFPLGRHHPSHQSHFPHVHQGRPHSVSLSARRVCRRATAFPRPATACTALSTFNSNVISVCSRFVSLLYTLSFPLLATHFCKMSRGFITRKQEVTTTTHSAVCA